MNTFEVLSLMISFGMFVIAVLGFFLFKIMIKILNTLRKRVVFLGAEKQIQRQKIIHLSILLFGSFLKHCCY